MNTQRLNTNNYEFEDVEIGKPLYGTFVNIRDVFINNAIKHHAKLRIKIPQGIGIHDPIIWKNTGKRVEQVFNFPDKPMILYGNYVKIEPPLTPDQKEELTYNKYLT